MDNSFSPLTGVEQVFSDFIKIKFEDSELKLEFPNPLLREDVFDLLDKFCIVLYFPLEGEKSNNGFHVKDMPLANGKTKDIVFINTAQTIEKQVFTAAHELGHLWKVDDTLLAELQLEDTPSNRETIANHFAASLLMPEEHFRPALSERMKLACGKDNRISVIDLLRIIVSLMNLFCVPMKAVVFRMAELDILPTESAQLLLEMKNTESTIVDIASEYGYTKFVAPTKKKWIEGLPELLDTAEKGQRVSAQKIKTMRELFGINPPKEIASDLQATVPFTSQEG